MNLVKSLKKALLEEASLKKGEDPEAYKKTASTGFLLAHPVKIKGESHRHDNNIPYHSSIKFFDKKSDSPHEAHQTASKLDFVPPNPKETEIEPKILKDRFGNDVYALGLRGKHAEKIKEHHKKFSHMGNPENYEWNAHISVPKSIHDEIKNAGHKTAHEAGIEFGPAELKHGSKILHTYHPKNKLEASEKIELEPLMKPYVSDAQRRWAHTAAGEKALGGKAAVHEWDEATKGKKLPEKVHKSEDFRIPSKLDVEKGNKDISEKTLSEIQESTAWTWAARAAASYERLAKSGDWKWKTDAEEYRHEAVEHAALIGDTHPHVLEEIHKSLEKYRKESEKNANELNKSEIKKGAILFRKDEELEKGALKNILTAGTMAGALASAHPAKAPTIPKDPSRAPASIIASNNYSPQKMLNAISMVESSGGKNVHHKPTSQGQAFGKFALMPSVIQDTIRLNPDLKNQYGKALKLQGNHLHRFMQDNPKLEDQIANKHLQRLEHHFGQDPYKIAAAWNGGITGTNRAIQSKQDISKYPYVQKFKSYYDKGK